MSVEGLKFALVHVAGLIKRIRAGIVPVLPAMSLRCSTWSASMCVLASGTSTDITITMHVISDALSRLLVMSSNDNDILLI